jgi:hypothetical protein
MQEAQLDASQPIEPPDAVCIDLREVEEGFATGVASGVAEVFLDA